MQNFSRNAYINLAASLSQTGDATSGLQHALLFAPTKKGHCKIKGFRGNSCVKKAWSSEQGKGSKNMRKIRTAKQAGDGGLGVWFPMSHDRRTKSQLMEY